MIKLSKTREDAIYPSRGSDGAAGWDLYAIEDAYIGPGERQLIDTGIASEFSDSIVGKIKPRSGLAYKYGIDVMAGVIDSDFRDSIKVLLINHGNEPFVVSPGDRIAQIIFTLAFHNVVMHEGPVSETVRGTNGFGSTGI